MTKWWDGSDSKEKRFTRSRKSIVVKALTDLRVLLSDKDKWTRVDNACTADGRPCTFDSKDATCWSLYGGLLKVMEIDGLIADNPDFGAAQDVLYDCAMRSHNTDHLTVNYHLGYDAVKHILECALKRVDHPVEAMVFSEELENDLRISSGHTGEYQRAFRRSASTDEA